MKSGKLTILYKATNGTEQVRCLVEKWEFHDKAMSVGEQSLQFGIVSEKPIPFAVGDYCIYRGQYFYLNNLPSVTQAAKPKQIGNAFKYENVKFDSVSGDLSRIMMLDITPTTGDYIAAVGTNYTGSANFQLFCGETRAVVLGKNVVYTPVCTLAGKIQANLDRAFPKDGWHIHVNLSSTKLSNGITQPVTHTDDKVLSFNNTTVAVALSEISNTFKLDYFIKGRDIYIGYTLGAVTGGKTEVGEGGSDNDYYYLGYGMGYADKDHQGKSLYEIKKTANSNQQIITRLRAMGSTKNMPYRYYHKRYNLSQALFPQNLQLPDTFETPDIKSQHNITRKRSNPYLRAVLGDTNDAYIDKNDDCFGTIEGLREGVGLWDGSNSELEEIYPTIKGATYGELRGAFCKDREGFTEEKGTSPDANGRKSFTNYDDLERIDEILAVGYLTNDGKVIDDAHVGNGIMPQEGVNSYHYQDFDTKIDKKKTNGGVLLEDGKYCTSGEETLFVVEEQNAGGYFTVPSNGHVWFGAKLTGGNAETVKVGYKINVYVKPLSTQTENLIGSYTCTEFKELKKGDTAYTEFELPSLPDAKSNKIQIPTITLSEKSDVRVTFSLLYEKPISNAIAVSITYFVGNSESKPSTVTNYKPQYRWAEAQYADYFNNTPFHVVIKDLGIQDFKAQFNGNDKPRIVMSDGKCVTREFEIGDDVKKVEYRKDGKIYKGWQLSLTRATDTSLHTYFPSLTDKLQAGDHYVLLGIEMPDAYVKAAEMRLLVAATQYLADNCETKYTYEPHIDEIFLARNYDNCVGNGDVTKSIYWNLYAGLKLPFWGLPETDDPNEILPIVNLTIDSLTIKEGEGIIPKVELTLNEKVEQSTYNKITTAIDKIYNGSLFSQLGIGGGLSASDVSMLVKRLGDERYLSKTSDDTAHGLITFLQGIKIGAGYYINKLGDALLNSIKAAKGNITDLVVETLTVTGVAKFFKLVVDEVKSTSGAYISSPANGFEIVSVEPLSSKMKKTDVPNAQFFKLYFLAEDGKKKIRNMWEVGDQALHFDFNEAHEGESENTENALWWACIVDKSKEPVDVEIAGKAVKCHYITVSHEHEADGSTKVNTRGWDAFNVTQDAPMWKGSAIPRESDAVAMLGHRFTSEADKKDKARQSAVYESSYASLDPELTAPLKAYYEGIDDFNLASHRGTYNSSGKSEFVGSLKVSDGRSIDKYLEDKTKTFVNGKDAVSYKLIPIEERAFVTGTVQDTAMADVMLRYKVQKSVGDTVSYVNIDAEGMTLFTNAMLYKNSDGEEVWFEHNHLYSYLAAKEQIQVTLQKGNDVMDSRIVDIMFKPSVVFNIDQRLGTVTSDIRSLDGKHTTLKQTVDGLYSEVADKASKTEIKQTAEEISLKVSRERAARNMVADGWLDVSGYNYGILDAMKKRLRVKLEAGKTYTLTACVRKCADTNILWSRLRIVLSGGSDVTTPTVYSRKGNAGVERITEYYLASSSSSGVTLATGGWTTNAGNLRTNSSNKYLWNYKKVEYKDGTSENTAPQCIYVSTAILSVYAEYMANDSDEGFSSAAAWSDNAALSKGVHHVRCHAYTEGWTDELTLDFTEITDSVKSFTFKAGKSEDYFIDFFPQDNEWYNASSPDRVCHIKWVTVTEGTIGKEEWEASEEDEQETGIYLKDKKVKMRTGNFVVENNKGEETFLIDENGKVNAKLIETDKLTAKSVATTPTAAGCYSELHGDVFALHGKNGCKGIEQYIDADGMPHLVFYTPQGDVSCDLWWGNMSSLFPGYTPAHWAEFSLLECSGKSGKWLLGIDVALQTSYEYYASYNANNQTYGSDKAFHKKIFAQKDTSSGYLPNGMYVKKSPYGWYTEVKTNDNRWIAVAGVVRLVDGEVVGDMKLNYFDIKSGEMCDENGKRINNQTFVL